VQRRFKRVAKGFAPPATRSAKKNGALLGVAVTSGLTGDLCWAVLLGDSDASMRTKAVDPAEF
jgi:hypothetical protein